MLFVFLFVGIFSFSSHAPIFEHYQKLTLTNKVVVQIPYVDATTSNPYFRLFFLKRHLFLNCHQNVKYLQKITCLTGL